MPTKNWIAFFRTSCISWGITNLIMLFLILPIMWTTGMVGYYFVLPLLLFTAIYVAIIHSIIKSMELNLLSIWKGIVICFLLFVIYQNLDFMTTLFMNDGRYPCKFGASCP